MPDLHFRNAATVLFDPVSDNRNSTRAILYSIGFREIEAAGELATFERHLQQRPWDLVIGEVTGDVGSVCRLVRRIRTGDLGLNPFSVVVVTAWDAASPVVQAVVQSGADDLLTRPFSVIQMRRRLETLIEARKRFVVTSDYIGPDRRRDGGRPGTAELVDVPNPLKGRVADRKSADEIQAEVGRMRKTVSTERMRRLAQRIAITAHLLHDRLGDGDVTYIDPEEITTLRRTCSELKERVADSPFASILELCAAALNLCDVLSAAESGHGKSLDMLSHLASAMQVTLNPERNEDELAHEIAATVQSIRKRA